MTTHATPTVVDNMVKTWVRFVGKTVVDVIPTYRVEMDGKITNVTIELLFDDGNGGDGETVTVESVVL